MHKLNQALRCWVLLVVLATSAHLSHAQLDPGGIDQVDIYYIPTQIRFRVEPYLRASLENDSVLIRKARFHLEVRELPGLDRIHVLTTDFLNAQHLATEQKENDIVRGLFRFTLISGAVEDLYMSPELRYYYKGKWYENEELTELLFQYLSGKARPAR